MIFIKFFRITINIFYQTQKMAFAQKKIIVIDAGHGGRDNGIIGVNGTKEADKKREQIMMFCMDDLVPQDHLLRIIDKAINWNFIYDLVEDKYCQDNGRPSMDPVMLIKIPFILSAFLST